MPEDGSENASQILREKTLKDLRESAIEAEVPEEKIRITAEYLQKRKEFHTSRLLSLTTNRESDILNKVAVDVVSDVLDILADKKNG
jgi:hypothetical protein